MKHAAMAVGTIAAAVATAALALDERKSAMLASQVRTTDVTLQTYRLAGDGPAVLFLHGDSAAASQWFPVMERLAPDFEVTTFDQRGHGESTGAQGGYDYAGRAADLAAVVQRSAYEEVILVAHSGSAGVALEYAAGNPQRVRGIFFLDPATDPRVMPEEMRQGFLGALASEAGLEAVSGYYSSIAGSDQRTIATVLADVARTTAEARLGVATALAYWNPEEALARWSGPAFALVTPANETSAAIHRLRVGFGHEVLPSDGHWPHLDDPDRVADSISAFARQLD